MSHYYTLQIARSINPKTNVIIPARKMKWRILNNCGDYPIFTDYEKAYQRRVYFQQILDDCIIRVKKIGLFRMLWIHLSWLFVLDD